MVFRKTILAATFAMMSPFAAEASSEVSCVLPEKEEVLECLNSQLLPEAAAKADKTYREYYRRLAQSYTLELKDEDLGLFKAKYFPEGQMPAIEIVGERLDGTGKDFSIRKDSIFSASKKRKEKILKENLNEALQFVAYFRVEISAMNLKDSEGLLALDGQTLHINLPEDRTIAAKNILEQWNSGDVLLTVSQANTPRSIMKIFAHFGSKSDKAGMAVLENWKLFNPISDFRVQLTAIYLKNADSLIAKIRSLGEGQLKALLEDVGAKESVLKSHDGNLRGFMLASLNSPDTYAGALDSIFSEKKSSGSGDINVINRTTGVCLVKVTNSHVIKVDWDESEFGEGGETAQAQVQIKDGEVSVTAASHQDVHMVNDKTWVGGVCVDTNDNVQVNLDGILRLIQKKMSERSLVKMTVQRAI
ncbi:MAG: hypothetical protein J7501_05150 [Bdellovibrio sp.]|nr:hypothetical protein [Bdellovibrio sp.]